MIIVRLKGGMGNQMFQYALGRALSIKYDVPLGLDMTYLLDRTKRPSWLHFTFREYDLGLFSIHPEIVKREQIPLLYRSYFSGKLMLYIDFIRQKVLKFRGTEKSYSFDPHILDLGPNGYLSGDWQSYKYFKSIANTIRTDFRFKNPFPEHIEKLKQEIELCDSVCVHVRRTDYTANKFNGLIGQSYYDTGIAEIQKKHVIDKLYLFSDDIEWCKKNLSFVLPAVFVGNEYAGAKAEGHLYLMRSCKHFIIANSTFSWWAAWLAENVSKIIVAPKKWFINDGIDTSDLIPSEWVRI